MQAAPLPGRSHLLAGLLPAAELQLADRVWALQLLAQAVPVQAAPVPERSHWLDGLFAELLQPAGQVWALQLLAQAVFVCVRIALQQLSRLA